MDQNSLVIEQTDAGAEFVNLLDKKVPVTAAFWARPTEANQWYLYVASGQIDDGGVDQAYREVPRLANQHPSPYLDPFQVRLIPAGDPLTQAALEVHRRYPGGMATRIGSGILGGWASRARTSIPRW